MTTTELVGPLDRVWFSGHVRLGVDLPRSTMDLRYRACVEHRTACDCREAMIAEDRAEFQGELKLIRDVFADALEGHPTFGDMDGRGEPLESGCCQCQGCAIVREVWRRGVGVLPFSAWAKAWNAARAERDRETVGGGS
jgi:hypothetical protein